MHSVLFPSTYMEMPVLKLQLGGQEKRSKMFTIMNQFLSFVKKEFYHIFRDRRTLFILLGMPVMQIIIFGFALTNEVKNSRIAILDQSKDEASLSLISQLEASRYFDIEQTISSY